MHACRCNRPIIACIIIFCIHEKQTVRVHTLNSGVSLIFYTFKVRTVNGGYDRGEVTRGEGEGPTPAPAATISRFRSVKRHRILFAAAISIRSLQCRVFSALDFLTDRPEFNPRTVCSLAYSSITFFTLGRSRAFFERRLCSCSNTIKASVLFRRPFGRPRLEAPTPNRSKRLGRTELLWLSLFDDIFLATQPTTCQYCLIGRREYVQR